MAGSGQRVSLVLIVAFLAAAAPFCAALSDGLVVHDASQDFIHLHGRDLVYVYGSGFTAHGSVVCEWLHTYQSTYSEIINDQTILCQSPRIPQELLDDLPVSGHFVVYFDGNKKDNRVVVSRTYRIGPAFTGFQPRAGFVAGGEWFIVRGEGFDDFESAEIFFDGVPCPAGVNDAGEVLPIIEGDGELRCRVPEGSFAQDAVIEVQFNGNAERLYRLDGIFRYGPRLTKVVPPCALLRGGSEVTLFGERMGDPITRDLLFPVRVEVLVGDVVQRRFFGSNVTVSPVDGSVSFVAPDLGDELRLGITPLIQLFFGRDSSALTIEGFSYGPIYSSIEPANLHVGGGDRVAVHGCGLESVAAADLSVLVFNGTNTVELCERGAGPGTANDTVRVVSDGDDIHFDRVECVSRPFSACAIDSVHLEPAVHLAVRNLDLPMGLGLEREANFSLGSVRVGPRIGAVSPARGARFGGQEVTIAGTALLRTGPERSEQWAAPRVYFENDAHALEPVQPLLVTDNALVVLTPEGRFGLDTAVRVEFTTAVGEPDQCQAAGGAYHFGPVCTGFTPEHGPLSGEAPVTVFGEGFAEEGGTAGDIEVRFCIDRLNPSRGPNCRAFEESATLHVSDSEIHSVTPSHRQNVHTVVGSNRLFGDVSDVFVHFLTPGSGGRDYNRQLLAEGLDVAVVRCPGVYEFGPRIDSFSPRKAPNGPYRSDSRDVGRAPTVVRVSGEHFQDEAYFAQQNTSLVSFGHVLGRTTTDSDTQVSTEPLPGHQSNADVELAVMFAPDCNATASSHTVRWGVSEPTLIAYNFNANGDPLDPEGFGLDPSGSAELRIFADGLEEFVDPGTGEFHGRCVLDRQPLISELRNLTSGGDYYVWCETFAVPFGSQVKVGLELGSDCGDVRSPVDWRNYIEVGTLTAAPRIDSVWPEFGRTTGSTPVEIRGVGFSQYDHLDVECVFGGYTTWGTVVSDTVVECLSPRTRGEFNTDVSVGLLIDGQNKVCEGQTFHYGPVCTGVVTDAGSGASGLTTCRTSGCTAAITGIGWQDCIVSDVEPIRNCAFREYLVEMVHPITGEFVQLPAPTNDTLSELNSESSLVFEIPPLDFCGAEPSQELHFQVRFPDAPISTNGKGQRLVTCSAANVVYVGPVVSEYTAEFIDAGAVYGWEGDVITVTGEHFTHAADSVVCEFRSEQRTVTSLARVLSDTLLECSMPKNAFDAWAELFVHWSGGRTVPCEAHVASVHWGPSLRGVTPDRGYSYTATPIAVTGFAFECCGITDIAVLLPGGVDATSQRAGPNNVTGTIPATLPLDAGIANLGLRFTSLRFTESPGNTEDLTELGFVTGPVVHDISPQRVALSGRDERITVRGEGFDDPSFTDVFCDFFSGTGALDVIGEIKVEIPDKSDTAIVCDVREFARTCGDWDRVRLRWRVRAPVRPGDDHIFYWKTEETARIDNGGVVFEEGPEKGGPPEVVRTFSEVPTYASGKLSYAAEVFSVEGAVSRPEGGTEIHVTMSNLRDWVAPDSATDFGPGVAVCRFGDYLSPLVPLEDVRQEEVPDRRYPTNFTCVTPPAPVGYEAPLTVLLNPLQARTDGPFRWMAHALDISRRWGSEFGREVVVVSGRGFCNYDSARCFFGAREALQTEITTDHSITCVSPPHPPGHVPLTVRLCDHGKCTFLGSPDVVQPVRVNTDFTYVGISGVFPHQGPVCGDTRVTVSGFGFKFFDEVRCVFNGHERAATALDDNTVQCFSPDLSSEFDPDDNNVFCVPLGIVGLRKGQRYTYRSKQDFEYGFPQVTAVAPASFDIDEAPVRLEVSGRYFNGGDPVNGTYRCLFGPYQTHAAIILGENDDDDLDMDTQVLCHSPARGDLRVGEYVVEVRYECDHNEEYTYNRFPVQVTQNSRIISISPKQGAELGGTRVTVTGDDLTGGTMYLCAFGDVQSGDYVAVQGSFSKGLKFPSAPISALPSTEDSLSAIDDDDDELSRFRAQHTQHVQPPRRTSRAVQNFEDQIVCQTPFYSVDKGTFVPVAVSIDGGKTWVHSPDRFYYQNVAAIDDGDVCNDIFAPTRTRVSESAAASLVPALSVLGAALLLLLAL
eukprot:TRINITY_DN777_c0_g1_i1.p2 TRINITY_DN777_c0_g1~~TRINITY_DN777_c0_g1_i1.p2  ORF type:complete len:2081 (-),score=803.19 TRINITY_DN777_c0_g1_i1:111-6353(-)